MGQADFSTGVTPNVQIDGTLTVGADGTGYDVIFYGGTASNSFTWDASENVLNILSTMKAADDVLNITVTDATTLSSGYGRGAYVSYTVSGTKTGSYAINGLGIDMTISEACPTVAGIEIYTAAISNKTVGNLYPFSIYCEDIGTAVSNFMALDIGINSTNLASSRHTGIRIRNHSGTAKSAIMIEEAFTDTILRHSPSGVDLNLFTLDNSSGAIFYWDDSEVKFRFNKGIYVDEASHFNALVTGIMAYEIEVSELGTATYDDVQDYINFFGDSTKLSGGAITDAGSNIATVASLTGWCKETDSDTAVGRFFNFAGGNTGALSNYTTSYIYYHYNYGGSPQLVVATSLITYGTKQDHILLGIVFNDDGTLHTHTMDEVGIKRGVKDSFKAQEISGAERVSGIVTTDGTSLALSVTNGVIYIGSCRHMSVIDGSPFSYWYTSDSGTNWTEETGQTALTHTYNNIATGKVPIGTGKYGVHWVFVDYDGTHMHVVYGRGNYNANQAEEASVPAVMPNLTTNYCILIAKVITHEGTTDLVITYPWTSVFTSSLATDHDLLGGVAASTSHTNYILHSLADAANDFLVASGNDAYVKKTQAETVALITGANFDVGAYDVRGQTITADGLTSGRVVYTGTNGVLSDDAGFLFGSDTLTVVKIGAFEATGAINFGSQAMTNVDIDSGTIDGVTSVNSFTMSVYATNTSILAGFLMPASSTGDFNCIFGLNSGTDLTDGEGNHLFGVACGHGITGGDYNTAMGDGAMQADSTALTGSYNSAFGDHVMRVLTSGNYNMGIGSQAFYDLTEGTNNLAVGFQAGYNLTDGDYNIFLGNQAGATETTGNSKLYITPSGTAATDSFLYGEMLVNPARLYLNAIGASAGGHIRDTNFNLRNHYWNGAASTDWIFSMYHDMTASGATPTSHVDFTINSVNLLILQNTDGTAAFSVFGVAAQTKQAHIIDADGGLADITTKFNTLLADLEGYGFLATS